MKITPFFLAAASVSLITGLAQAATITTVGTTGVFDESTNATNQLDVELTASTLVPFKAAVQTAYNNNLGGVIDWETGVAPVASSANPGHSLTSVTADYGVGASSTLTVTFDQQMALYTNNINNQISVLSAGSVANTSNALTTFNANSVAYTMTFSGASVSEIGAALPSRSTYSLNGVTAVNFRATANYSVSGTEALEFTVGGTAGTGDTFLHFAAPTGESIDSLTVTWIGETGGTLANGQRRPILDDFAFIVVPEPSSMLMLGLAGMGLMLRRRR